MTFEAGASTTQDFTQPLISAGTAVNDQTICGDFTYQVFKVSSGVLVAQTLIEVSQVAGTQNRLTATTSDEADQGIHAMRLIVSLDAARTSDYPTLQVDFNLVV